METQITASRMRRGLLAAGAVSLPFMIFSAYMIVSRWPKPWFNTPSDYIALGIATAGGAICMWRLITHARWQLTAMVVYLPVCCAVLFIYAFWFVCTVFENCL
jgi:hypothetical protein